MLSLDRRMIAAYFGVMAAGGLCASGRRSGIIALCLGRSLGAHASCGRERAWMTSVRLACSVPAFPPPSGPGGVARLRFLWTHMGRQPRLGASRCRWRCSTCRVVQVPSCCTPVGDGHDFSSSLRQAKLIYGKHMCCKTSNFGHASVARSPTAPCSRSVPRFA